MREAIMISSMSSDGEVSVLIGDKYYTYYGVDTALYDKIRRLERYTPWKSLRVIKNSAKSFEKEVV